MAARGDLLHIYKSLAQFMTVIQVRFFSITPVIFLRTFPAT